MSIKLKLFLRTIIFVILITTFFSVFTFINTTKNNNEVLKSDSVKATNDVILYKRWFDEIQNIVSKSNIKELTFTKSQTEVDNIPQAMLKGEVSIGASSTTTDGYQLGDIIDRSVNLKAYIQKIDNSSSYCKIIVYSPDNIFAPEDCSNLFSSFGSSSNTNVILNLKNFDTSKTKNMSSMFSSSYFGNINFSNCNFITSKVENMSYMFNNCYSINQLDLSRFDTSKVTNMSYMFYSSRCRSFGNGNEYDIKIGNNFTTSNVENMSFMFAGYSTSSYYASSSSLFQQINLSQFNTSNVKNMRSMFSYCIYLNSLTFSKSFNTSKVEDMREMFNFCTSLQSLDLSKAKFNTANVKDMSGMFRASSFKTANNSSGDLKFGNEFSIENTKNLSSMFAYGGYASYIPLLESIDLSGWIVPSGRLEESEEFKVSFANMFYYCENLNKVVFGNNFKVDNVTEMSYMFAECKNLTDLNFGNNFIPNYVVNFTHMFYNCSSLVGINLRNFKTNSARDMSYMFYNCNNLTSLDLSAFETSNVIDMTYMFAVKKDTNGNVLSRLSNLTLKFNTNNVERMKCMFQYCYALTSLELGTFNTSNVIDMSYMFDGCSGLSSIGANNSIKSYALNFGNMFYTSKVKDMSYMFSNCFSSTIIDLKLFDTQNVENMTYMFNNCKNAKKIELGSKFVTNKVRNMKYMFADCSSLNSELDLTLFNTDLINSTERMFYNCSNLKNIYLGECFTLSNVIDMQYMFYNCSSLLQLDLSNFETALVKDMSYLFSNCSTLTQLNLSSFNTSKVINMCNMFSGCSSLQSAGVNTTTKTFALNFGNNFVTDSVTDMSNMFAYCSNLNEISFNSKFSTRNVNNFSSMFLNCSSLTDLSAISNFSTNSVKDMSSMFKACSSLKTINLQNFNINNNIVVLGLLDACSDLETLITPNIEQTSQVYMDLPTVFSNSGNNYIQLSYKTNNKQLKRAGIFLYSSFKSIIGETVCQKIVSITITNNLQNSELTKKSYNTIELLQSNAQEIYAVGTGNTSGTLYNYTSPLKAYMLKSEADENFYDCIIYCPQQNGSSLNIFAPASCDSLFTSQDDYGTFFSNLKSIYFDNFKTDYTVSMSGMFKNCNKLINAKMNTLNVENVTNFEDMFEGCENLAYIYTFSLPTNQTIEINLPSVYYNVNRSDTNEYWHFPSKSTELARQFNLMLDISGTNGILNLPSTWNLSDDETYVYRLYFYNENIGKLPAPNLGHRVFDKWGTIENDEFIAFSQEKFSTNYDITLVPSWKKILIEFDYGQGSVDAKKVGYFTTEIVQKENEDETITNIEKPKIILEDIPQDWESNFVDGKMLVYVGDEFGLLPNAKFSYVFAGWYLNNNYVKSSDLVPNSDNDSITLVAKWTEEVNEEDKAVITFNANGGVIDFRNGVTVTQKQKEVTNEFGETVTVNYIEIEVVKCDITWTSQGGKEVAVVDTVKDIEYGYMPNVNYRDHKFLGWFTQQYGGDQILSSDVINGDITLYAQWEAVEDTAKVNSLTLIYIFCGVALLIAVAMFFAFTRRSRSANKSVTVNEKAISDFNNKSEDLDENNKGK